MSDERARWQAAGVVVLVLAILAFFVARNPANLPERWIERWLLRDLPLGSSIVAVRDAIDREKWKTVDEGVSDVGSAVVVEIGRATLPRSYVYAHFSFDRFGRLGGVRVEKRAAEWEPVLGRKSPAID